MKKEQRVKEDFLSQKHRFLMTAALGVLLLALQLTTGLLPASAQGLPDSYRIWGVPLYTQQHNLSCEYASARMLTAYWGSPVSEWQFIQGIPVSANPHFGYRGNIDGSGGGTRDYGIYNEPLANYLQRVGFNARAFYGDVATLKAEIAAGHPVIAWVTIAMQWADPVRVYLDGSPAKLVPGEHTVVVTGYDQGGVYVNGPAQGIRAWFDWSDFLRTWGYFDNMSLVIYP
ncbi:MAG TPA: C39 family peptidase [Chloroflexia bacterium]|nr:C39 family peptidase [Chloroflexia bacterium]